MAAVNQSLQGQLTVVQTSLAGKKDIGVHAWHGGCGGGQNGGWNWLCFDRNTLNTAATVLSQIRQYPFSSDNTTRYFRSEFLYNWNKLQLAARVLRDQWKYMVRHSRSYSPVALEGCPHQHSI